MREIEEKYENMSRERLHGEASHNEPRFPGADNEDIDDEHDRDQPLGRPSESHTSPSTEPTVRGSHNEGDEDEPDESDDEDYILSEDEFSSDDDADSDGSEIMSDRDTDYDSYGLADL